MSGKIVTITCNPCIDKTITIHGGVRVGGTNRVLRTREELSGKGLNVSYVLNQWNIPTLCLGYDYLSSEASNISECECHPSALSDTKIITCEGSVHHKLHSMHIESRLTTVSGKLRTNIKVFDETNQEMTEFNEKGNPVSESDVKLLFSQIQQCIEDMDTDDILVLTGSVPPGVPTDFYEKLISIANAKNIRTVLDASGELLRNGVKAKPYLIKPNQDEIMELLNLTEHPFKADPDFRSELNLTPNRDSSSKPDCNSATASSSKPDCNSTTDSSSKPDCNSATDSSSKPDCNSITASSSKPDCSPIRSALTDQLLIDRARELLTEGVSYLCITLGSEGALMVGREGVYKADPLKLQVKGVQGAGDSVVAGICAAMLSDLPIEEMLRYGMAAAGGSLLLEGTQMCHLSDFQRLKPQVVIHKLNN